MVTLELKFLGGTYAARKHHRWSEPEWPPHPARLFSALVATHYATPAEQDRLSKQETALIELQGQEPPSLRLCEAKGGLRENVVRYVPTNDSLKLNSKDAVKKASKKEWSFPATPVDGNVYFQWPNWKPTRDAEEGLDSLLEGCVRLGHSSSFVIVRRLATPVDCDRVPVSNGQRKMTLRWVETEQLEKLRSLHARVGYKRGRVLPATSVGYAKRGHLTEKPSSTEFEAATFVSFELTDFKPPIEHSATLSKAFRTAVLAQAKDTMALPAIVSGHNQDGTVFRGSHLAIVAHPFVQAEWADGRVLELHLIFPRGRGYSEEKRALARLLSTWESKNVDGCLDVFLPGGTRVRLSRQRKSNRFPNMAKSSRDWVSITPVALDRHPGSMRTPEGRARAVDTIRQACAYQDLPDLEDVRLVGDPVISGTVRASAHAPYPAKKGSSRRFLTHVELRFANKIRGPLILGAGRYDGLGTFIPRRAHEG
jgi:CRISPR-associated protein Csb2